MSRVPYQLLELHIISAQDLARLCKSLHAYAVAWVNPDRKLKTRTDQSGQGSPIWNEKFVFRVDNRTLDSETSSVVIEIYAQGWLRDLPVGSVTVLLSNLVPPSVREERSSRRFVALQIRRPSGRPQGIFNMGVSLLDNTMRSMPLDYVRATVGSDNDPMARNKESDNEEKMESRPIQPLNGKNQIQLRRWLSDLTDLTSKLAGGKKTRTTSVCNGSLPYYHPSVVNGAGSAVNGSVCNSDVGPSPSVVAAAVAWGLYPTHLGPPPKPGSSVLEDWAVEEASVEGLKSKIERWRMEAPPGRVENGGKREVKRNRRRRTAAAARDDDGSRLFTCFGNAYGCEFTIVCGANHNRGRRNRHRGRGGHTGSKASVSDADS